MPLSKVLASLKEIENTPSTNDKILLLKKFLENGLFLRVIKYALSGDMKYHIKKLPVHNQMKGFIITPTANEILDYLKELSKQSGATNADKKKLFSMLSDADTHEVVKRICTKDLKCGASAKLVNKARSGTVNTIPYMRCSTDKKIDNITYPAIIQEKADGMYVACMINKKGQIKFVTRNGKTVHQLSYLKNVILNGRLNREQKSKKVIEHWGILNNSNKINSYFDTVYTGELVVRKNGQILDRRTGNGILNSCIHGTADPKDAECVVLRVWDCLPLQAFYNGYHDVLYNTRLFETTSFVNVVNDSTFVNMVMTKRVDTYEEAHSFYAKIRKAGGEGAILKNNDLIWKDHTSTNQIKMKNVEEAELEIIGFEPGKEGSKYEMCMGALRCQSSCKKLKVSVGSGFSDEEREADWEIAIGSIITVEFESVIQDKRTKQHSLFLPRFASVREDKDIADTLKEIQNR